MSHPARGARVAAAAAGAVLLCALAGPRLAFPASALLDGGDAVLLDADHPTWGTDLDLGRIRSVVVQTSMIHAATLAAGTPVATVRLLGTGFAPVELRLRSGKDTAEWAARRSDVAAAMGRVAPPPWLTWVAGDFFGQRYRARLRLPPGPTSFARLEIDLAGGLPPATGIAIYQVELEP